MSDTQAEDSLKKKLEGVRLLSGVQDLSDLGSFMDDEDFSLACELALKCIANPQMPHAAVRDALLLMQAWAFTFRMKGQVFMTIKKGKAGTDENVKKNVYFSVSEQCHELAQTLKYLLKETY